MGLLEIGAFKEWGLAGRLLVIQECALEGDIGTSSSSVLFPDHHKVSRCSPPPSPHHTLPSHDVLPHHRLKDVKDEGDK
jgi:hypothetical protein